MSSMRKSIARRTTAWAAGLMVAVACGRTHAQLCNPGPWVLPPEWGDAPEGWQAYPDAGVPGLFPTCFGGPSGCIQHAQIPGGVANNAYFGMDLDYELDGNAGLCGTIPLERDECYWALDGDAGLIMPTAFTSTPHGPPFSAVTCSGLPPTSLGRPCTRARWGFEIDITLTNRLHVATGAGQPVYLNVIADLNRNGTWDPYPVGPICSAQVPEHIVRNLPVQSGFTGRASQLPNADFDLGPHSGYVWFRFSLTPEPVLFPWDGSGFYEGGETEDYMLWIEPEEAPIEFGDAPHGVPAYPPYLVQGQFPTCSQTGARIEHAASSMLFLGSGVDLEFEGNADDCAFTEYDKDECFGGEAGIVVPRPYTIRDTASGLAIQPCEDPAGDLGPECSQLQWGTDLDVQIVNNLPLPAYLNVLADWDQDGDWTSPPFDCNGPVREHVIDNLAVTAGFAGPLSHLAPPLAFKGRSGWVWVRVTVSTSPAPIDWDGGGDMGDGETEDYLLYVAGGATDTQGLERGALRVGEASPNPTFAGTRLDLDLPAQAEVRIQVYDAKGRLVRDMGGRAMARGGQRVQWDGLDAAGVRPAAGVYFLRVEATGGAFTRRVLLLN